MKKLGTVALALGAALSVLSCFSSWQGDSGYLRIGNGGAASTGGGPSRAAIPGVNEKLTMRYEVTLTGPGGVTRATLGPDGGDIPLAPGRYAVLAYAYNGDTPPLLRGYAQWSLDIGPGKTETVMLRSVIGIQNERQLYDALTNGTTYSTGVNAYLAGPGDETILLIENDIDLGSIASSISVVSTSATKFTLLAPEGTTRTIRRGAPGVSFVIGLGNMSGELSVGLEGGEGGTLIFDGGNISATAPFFSITGSGGPRMMIYAYSEIVNCVNNSNGGAISVDGGSFSIYRGKISNNSVYISSGAAKGGAISLTGGSVDIGRTGGAVEVSHNKAHSGSGSSVAAQGGAIYVGPGTSVPSLYIEGNVLFSDNWVIHDNSAGALGGAICIDPIPTATVSLQGPGIRFINNHADGSGGTFDGGAIYKSTSYGGTYTETPDVVFQGNMAGTTPNHKNP